MKPNFRLFLNLFTISTFGLLTNSNLIATTYQIVYLNKGEDPQTYAYKKRPTFDDFLTFEGVAEGTLNLPVKTTSMIQGILGPRLTGNNVSQYTDPTLMRKPDQKFEPGWANARYLDVTFAIDGQEFNENNIATIRVISTEENWESNIGWTLCFSQDNTNLIWVTANIDANGEISFMQGGDNAPMSVGIGDDGQIFLVLDSDETTPVARLVSGFTNEPVAAEDEGSQKILEAARQAAAEAAIAQPRPHAAGEERYAALPGVARRELEMARVGEAIARANQAARRIPGQQPIEARERVEERAGDSAVPTVVRQTPTARAQERAGGDRIGSRATPILPRAEDQEEEFEDPRAEAEVDLRTFTSPLAGYQIHGTVKNFCQTTSVEFPGVRILEFDKFASKDIVFRTVTENDFVISKNVSLPIKNNGKKNAIFFTTPSFFKGAEMPISDSGEKFFGFTGIATNENKQLRTCYIDHRPIDYPGALPVPPERYKFSGGQSWQNKVYKQTSFLKTDSHKIDKLIGEALFEKYLNPSTLTSESETVEFEDFQLQLDEKAPAEINLTKFTRNNRRHVICWQADVKTANPLLKLKLIEMRLQNAKYYFARPGKKERLKLGWSPDKKMFFFCEDDFKSKIPLLKKRLAKPLAWIPIDLGITPKELAEIVSPTEAPSLAQTAVRQIPTAPRAVRQMDQFQEHPDSQRHQRAPAEGTPAGQSSSLEEFVKALEEPSCPISPEEEIQTREITSEENKKFLIDYRNSIKWLFYLICDSYQGWEPAQNNPFKESIKLSLTKQFDEEMVKVLSGQIPFNADITASRRGLKLEQLTKLIRRIAPKIGGARQRELQTIADQLMSQRRNICQVYSHASHMILQASPPAQRPLSVEQILKELGTVKITEGDQISSAPFCAGCLFNALTVAMKLRPMVELGLELAPADGGKSELELAIERVFLDNNPDQCVLKMLLLASEIKRTGENTYNLGQSFDKELIDLIRTRPGKTIKFEVEGAQLITDTLKTSKESLDGQFQDPINLALASLLRELIQASMDCQDRMVKDLKSIRSALPARPIFKGQARRTASVA